MAIVKMQKVCVIGLDNEKEEFMSRLMDFGVVELTDQTAKLSDEIWAQNVMVDESRDAAAKLEEKISRAGLALEVIEKYGKLKQPLFATRRRVSAARMKRLLTDSQGALTGQVEDLLNLNDRINALSESRNKLEQDETSLKVWQSYDLPLELTGTKQTTVQTGVLPMGTDLDALTGALAGQAETDGTVFKIISRDKDLYYAAILMLTEQASDVQTILKQYGFSQVTFKDMEGTASENLIRIDGEKDVLREKYEAAVKEAATKAAWKAGIEEYADMLNVAADKEKIKTKLLKTKQTFFLEGWIPERCRKKAAELLDACECYYAFRKPEAEEEVPVLLENKSFFRPTEAITEMYSLPSYWGFDPTSIYALFYIVFFGMMFSDAGYGLIMAIGCFVILKKFDLEGTTWKMIKLFFYCGISTFAWGALFGGWFGDVVTVFSSTFLGRAAELKPLWFNPLDDPMKLLILSLILGVIHLFVGMGIQAYMEIREGKWMDAICGEGVWYLTILGLAALLGGSTLGIAGLGTAGKWMSILGAAGVLLAGARGKKGIGMLTGAFANLYNITSWLSDILSYARLLALGLATGVIAQVVNTMGSLFGGGIAGLVLFVLIFAVGHAINFAINMLGAFIHSARLQYVEFFGKFYVDGGEPFDPFRKKTKYIRFENEE